MAAFIFPDTPWLGGEHDGYERVALENYLEIRRSSSQGLHPSREYLAQLQCLITFGLLEAVMEVKIAENILLEFNSSGGRVLTSKHLPALLLEFRNRFLQLQGNDIACIPDACWQWARRIEAAYTYAFNLLFAEVLEGDYSTFSTAGLDPKMLAEVIIQMACIFEAVSVSTYVFFEEVRPRVHIGVLFMWIHLVPYQYRATILPEGWCPSIVDGIARSSQACILGYARTLKSPKCRASEGHGACTPESCAVNKRDTSNDAPKHASESCKCNNSMPSLEDVKRFLQNRQIPVVDYCQDGGLSVKNSASTPFVAISHVWGDGLRGTTEKGLPACQVERLAEMVSWIMNDLGKAGDGAAFWVDTLCIPEVDDLRHRAIGLMARTYKEAEAVLVIDSGIREISSSAPFEERLLNVLYSRWMQRLWTFQEAALTKTLYFEFSDALVSLDELVPLRHVSFLHDINPVLSRLCGEVLGHLKGSTSGDIGLAFMARVLRERSVSRKSDELLAVCGVMNLDGFKLARISDSEDRMIEFLLQVRKLPSSIIFDLLLPREWRLDKEGFRWAPKTFMRGDEIEYMGELSDERDALCTPTGLEAEYVAITQGIVIEGEKHEWYISHRKEGCTRIYKVEYYTKQLGPVHIPSCNTILLDGRRDGGFPPSKNLSACAGVWVDPAYLDGASGGGDRVLCKFRASLILRVVTGTELSEVEKSHPIMTVESVRRIRAKVV